MVMMSIISLLTVNPIILGVKGCVFPRPDRLWPRERIHATFTPNTNYGTYVLSSLSFPLENDKCGGDEVWSWIFRMSGNVLTDNNIIARGKSAKI